MLEEQDRSHLLRTSSQLLESQYLQESLLTRLILQNKKLRKLKTTGIKSGLRPLKRPTPKKLRSYLPLLPRKICRLRNNRRKRSLWSEYKKKKRNKSLDLKQQRLLPIRAQEITEVDLPLRRVSRTLRAQDTTKTLINLQLDKRVPLLHPAKET